MKNPTDNAYGDVKGWLVARCAVELRSFKFPCSDEKKICVRRVEHTFFEKCRTKFYIFVPQPAPLPSLCLDYFDGICDCVSFNQGRGNTEKTLSAGRADTESDKMQVYFCKHVAALA